MIEQRAPDEWCPPPLSTPFPFPFLAVLGVGLRDGLTVALVALIGNTTENGYSMEAWFPTALWHWSWLSFCAIYILNAVIRPQGRRLLSWVLPWTRHLIVALVVHRAWGGMNAYRAARSFYKVKGRFTILLPRTWASLVHADVHVVGPGVIDVSGTIGPGWWRWLFCVVRRQETLRGLVWLSLSGALDLIDSEELIAVWQNRLVLLADPGHSLSLHVLVRPFPPDLLAECAGPVAHEARDLAKTMVRRELLLAVPASHKRVLNKRLLALLGTGNGDTNGLLASAGLDSRMLTQEETRQLVDEAYGERGPAVWYSPRQFAIETGASDPPPLSENTLVENAPPTPGKGWVQYKSFVISGLPSRVKVGWTHPVTGGSVLANWSVHLDHMPRWQTEGILSLKASVMGALKMGAQRYQRIASLIDQTVDLSRTRDTGIWNVSMYVSVPKTQVADAELALERMVGRDNFYAPTLYQQQARQSAEPFGRDTYGDKKWWTDSHTIAAGWPSSGGIYVPGGVLIGKCARSDEPIVWNPLWEGDETSVGCILGGSGSGKRLALDTPLATPTGWTTMGDVQVGDTVFDEQGKPCRVTYVSPINLGDSYEVRFSDKSMIVADGEHLWDTWTYRARTNVAKRLPVQKHRWRRDHRRYAEDGSRTRTTLEIRQTLEASNGGKNHSIQTTAPLDLPNGELPIPPYVLGAWLGDGRSQSAYFTTADPDILGEIEREGVSVGKPLLNDNSGAAHTYYLGFNNDGHGGHWTLRTNNMGSRLRRLGVLDNKHVPAIYLRSSVSQRLALLQGLMDTDGGTNNGQGEFTSTRQCLSDAVFELVVSLGMKATRDQRPAKLNGRAYGTAYRVKFTPTMRVFRLDRKAKGIRFDSGQQAKRKRRYIVSVQQCTPVPMRCIAVDSPSHLYLAGTSMIPTHNTNTEQLIAAEMMQPAPGHPNYGHPTPCVVAYYKPFDEWAEFCRVFGGQHHHLGHDWKDVLRRAPVGHTPIVAFNLMSLSPNDQVTFLRELSDRVMAVQEESDFIDPLLYIVGEAWLMVKQKEGAEHLQQMALQVRTLGITLLVDSQFADHLYRSPEARDVIRGSSMWLLLRLNKSERRDLAELLDISPTGMNYLAQVAQRQTLTGGRAKMRGRGLIHAHGLTTTVQVLRLGYLQQLLDETNPRLRARKERTNGTAHRSSGLVLPNGMPHIPSLASAND